MERVLPRAFLTRSAKSPTVDYATGLGILAAFGLVFLAITLGGGATSFFDISSLAVVVGGTLGATLIHYPLEALLRTANIIRPAFFPDAASRIHRVQRLLELARKSRGAGTLALESDIMRENDPFFRKCLELLVDDLPPEEVERILEIELTHLEDRHRSGAQLLQTMGTIAPAMGLIGTLIGLVQMLDHMDDPSQVGPGMALALLTTFYGAMLAYIVFLPLAGKLRARSREETLLKELTLEGTVCIIKGTNPRIVEQHLMCFLPPEERVSEYS